jgi:hypothetical protein
MESKKKIVIIAFTNIYKDVRVLRTIQSLSKTFEITTIGYGLKPEGVNQHHQIPDELPYLPLNIKGILSLLLGKFHAAVKNTKAVQWTSEILDSSSFDAIYCNDVQTVCLLDNRKFSRVLIDMHEYAPLEMEDDWRFRLLLQRYYTFLCEKYLPRADAVITVSDGLAQKYADEFAINVSVVYNARELCLQTSAPTQSSKVRLIHTGLAAKGRRLQSMINAVKKLPQYELDMYLVEAPRQKATLRALKNKAAKTTNCRILPPVPSTELPQTISQYDAGLVFLAPSNFSLKHSMPNKLFDCVQARVPIISGPSPDIAQFIEQRSIGFIAEGFLAEDLIKLLREIDHDALRSMREDLEDVALQLNAESEGQKLLHIVESVLQRAQ